MIGWYMYWLKLYGILCQQGLGKNMPSFESTFDAWVENGLIAFWQTGESD